MYMCMHKCSSTKCTHIYIEGLHVLSWCPNMHRGYIFYQQCTSTLYMYMCTVNLTWNNYLSLNMYMLYVLLFIVKIMNYMFPNMYNYKILIMIIITKTHFGQCFSTSIQSFQETLSSLFVFFDNKYIFSYRNTCTHANQQFIRFCLHIQYICFLFSSSKVQTIICIDLLQDEKQDCST